MILKNLYYKIEVVVGLLMVIVSLAYFLVGIIK